MSQIPPPGGWIDPYGTPQPGYPPPGYWQASDGRWYPPESRAGQPFAAPTAPAPQPQPQPMAQPYGPGPAGPPPYPGPAQAPTQPQYGYQGPGTANLPTQGAVRSGSGTGRTGLWVALGVVAALVVVGLGLVALRGRGKSTDSAGTSTTAPVVPTSAAGVSTTRSGGTAQASTTAAASAGGGTGKDGAVVQSCTRLGKDKFEVDMTSKLAGTADFSLTVALLDDAGKRVGDSTAYVEHLRAGEHAVEQEYLLDDKGSKCEVVAIDHYDVKLDPSLLADVSACTTGKADSLGFFNGSLTVTNSAQVTSDYSVQIAIVDAKGVRRGSGSSIIKAVRPKETAPGDVFNSVPAADGYRCEVIGADRRSG